MKYAVILRQDEEGNWLASAPAFPGRAKEAEIA